MNFVQLMHTNPNVVPSANLDTVGLSLVHDLSNAVSALLLDIERLQQDSAAIAESIKVAQQNLVDQKISQIFLRQLLRSIVRSYAKQCDEKDINLQLYAPSEVAITANRHKFEIVVSNLIQNAIDATMGSLQKSITVQLQTNAQFVTLRVIDTGDCPEERDFAALFVPGFSTKEEAGHLGVGLHLVQHIVEQEFYGKVVATRRNGETIFTVQIPKQGHHTEESFPLQA